MKRRILLSILFLARWSGLFALARHVTKADLRILCYHGIAIDDESAFRPGLFMTAATFARRIRYLVKAGYPVLPLREALDRLEAGTLPRGATVITIDDGWYGSYQYQIPILCENGIPATFYVSSYYLLNQTTVFNVALRYVLWKSGIRTVDLSKLDLGGEVGTLPCRVSDAEEIFTVLNTVAESLDSAEARQVLLRRFCDAVNFDWREMEAKRQIAFMTVDEARSLAADGIDIQLHTHRHRFLCGGIEEARREIEDNRSVIEPITGAERRHFCYPNGEYTPTSLAHLAALGIDSATTTNPGFNRKTASRLELTRFLDSETVSDLEFAAEMSGFFELIRRAGYRV